MGFKLAPRIGVLVNRPKGWLLGAVFSLSRCYNYLAKID